MFICMIAFMCHHNTFLVYQSMREATLERWEKVTHLSIGFAWSVAALFGIAGYSTFRALSQGACFKHQQILNIKYLRFSFESQSHVPSLSLTPLDHNLYTIKIN